MKRTKIIATLGPATDDLDILESLLVAGVDLIRLNLSHGTHQQHQNRLEQVRRLAFALKKPVGVIADLQGPKIRIGRFKTETIFLNTGDHFVIDPNWSLAEGTEQIVGIDYPQLNVDLKVGDLLLLNDGLIVLEVEKIVQSKIECVVQLGGHLASHKGINRRGGGLTADWLTAKDRIDLAFAAAMKVDYVALSFVRQAADVFDARALLKAHHSDAGLIAKIERVEAIEALDEIIQASDGVMVARGDLGVELGYAEVPAVQKQIIARASDLGRLVITATQMMESMVHHPMPTRAEVSDVANAVLDGTDAVMLSSETAVGKFPVKTVEMIDQICVAIEGATIPPVPNKRGTLTPFHHLHKGITCPPGGRGNNAT